MNLGGLKYSASGSRQDSEEEMQVTTKARLRECSVVSESNSSETWRLHRRWGEQSVRVQTPALRLLSPGSGQAM